MSPDSVKLYEPGLAAHMMDVLGHDYRCAPQPYLPGRPMPAWPAHRPLVAGIPSAVFAVQWDAEAQRRALKDWSDMFCAGLRAPDILDSDRYAT